MAFLFSFDVNYLRTQWGLLSNEKSARNHNVNTLYSWQIVGKQCRKNMFFKHRKDKVSPNTIEIHYK